MGKVALVIVGILFLAVSGMPAHSATEAKVGAGDFLRKGAACATAQTDLNARKNGLRNGKRRLCA